MIKLQYKVRNFCCALLAAMIAILLSFQAIVHNDAAFADDENSDGGSHFVTIYDEDSVLTVKTSASTVQEVLDRAGISVNASDIVDPGLETPVAGEEYHINIHRARPAVVIDGSKKRYVMSASFDPRQVAVEAGLTIYDGDEITPIMNQNFLEAGAVSAFRVERNGGRTITLEESIPYPTETRYDYNLAKGETRLEQVGTDGRKSSVYEVLFDNNVEVSRTLVLEEVKLEPVPEIVVVGAKLSIPPGQEVCAGWLREIGVPDGDLEAALYIIYHESGCRVDAENPHSGAYGIPQALPGSKMASAGADWKTNPLTQLRWMDSYVKGRYGGWQQALSFKQAKGWY